jgi:hypothetical protein
MVARSIKKYIKVILRIVLPIAGEKLAYKNIRKTIR